MKNDFSKLRIPKSADEVKGFIPMDEYLRKEREKTAEPEKKENPWLAATKEQKKRWLRLPYVYWIEELKDLDALDYAVLSIFIAHMNIKRKTWPATSTIARILKIAENTAKKHRDVLVKKGIIKPIGKKGRVVVFLIN